RGARRLLRRRGLRHGRRRRLLLDPRPPRRRRERLRAPALHHRDRVGAGRRDVRAGGRGRRCRRRADRPGRRRVRHRGGHRRRARRARAACPGRRRDRSDRQAPLRDHRAGPASHPLRQDHAPPARPARPRGAGPSRRTHPGPARGHHVPAEPGGRRRRRGRARVPSRGRSDRRPAGLTHFPRPSPTVGRADEGGPMTTTVPASTFETPLKFAYWVPNVSGGLVVSTIEQRTDWQLPYNSRLARIAEDSGFEYAPTQTHYAASHGEDKQHEASAFSLALLGATERLRVIAAFHPGMWHPGVLAKWLITADHLSGGRAAVNIVSGWLKDEFVKFGLDWLEHDERYVRTEEFIRAL